MREPLTIAVAQPLSMPYDVAANALAHAAAVRAAGARVVVFPELSLTGYELDAPAITPGVGGGGPPRTGGTRRAGFVSVTPRGK